MSSNTVNQQNQRFCYYPLPPPSKSKSSFMYRDSTLTSICNIITDYHKNDHFIQNPLVKIKISFLLKPFSICLYSPSTIKKLQIFKTSRTINYSFGSSNITQLVSIPPYSPSCTKIKSMFLRNILMQPPHVTVFENFLHHSPNVDQLRSLLGTLYDVLSDIRNRLPRNDPTNHFQNILDLFAITFWFVLDQFIWAENADTTQHSFQNSLIFSSNF